MIFSQVNVIHFPVHPEVQPKNEILGSTRIILYKKRAVVAKILSLLFLIYRIIIFEQYGVKCRMGGGGLFSKKPVIYKKSHKIDF